MKRFFNEMEIEVRLTHGTRWDDVILKSMPEKCRFMSELTKDK